MSVVGIDLGTTNTVTACVRSGKVHVLADEQGQRLLPSVVSFHPNGDVLVGASAKARRVIDAKNTVYSHKRLIGRSWSSPEISQARTRFPFELREGPGQGPLVHARGQDYTLPEISAFVLKRARQIAETALGTQVEKAVITVPANFNELQRASTKVAGRVSGLEVLRILNEPTAAALAYGLGRTGNERVAVYDFGGGTFDCTLLDLSGNVFEVLATAGDSFLGGDDIDALIADRMAEEFLKQHRYDPRGDAQGFEKLKTAAERIKMELSTNETFTVPLKEIGFGAGGSGLSLMFTMTRKDFEALVKPLVERTFKVTQDALALARLTPTSFDKIILVGGSTRVPMVRQRVEAFFGTAPLDRVNPDEVVAIGAAIQAAALSEGAKRKPIPAPPGVPGQHRTLPGVGDEEHTQTTEFDKLQQKLASQPPTTKSGPPGAPRRPGMAGAASPPGGARSPSTQPMGARGPAKGADADDPSIQSFPDLAVPTPFEWFPSSGAPSSGETMQRPGAASERSFGGNTVTGEATSPGRGADDSITKDSPHPGGPGFGAIDEPPSLYSTPSASVPSFPSMGSGQGGAPRMPSPLGEPSSDGLPGEFGEVRDLSLISTTGASISGNTPSPALLPSFGEVRDLSLISSSGVSNPGVPSSGAGDFGHVSDLSLISTPGTTTQTGTLEGLTEVRRDARAEDDDKGNTLQLDARGRGGEDADLPAVVEQADLPAVAARAAPARKPGSAMLGKPPPLVAPQPFGRMERVDGTLPPQTSPMPPGQQGGPSRQPPAPAAGQPRPAPSKAPPAKPLNRTAAMGAQPTQTLGSTPQQPPPVPQRPQASPFASAPPPPQPNPFASAPPPPQQGFGAPPPQQGFGAPPPQQGFGAPPGGHTQQQGGFGSAPPPHQPFGSAPPPNQPFGSAPPPHQGFGSAPPQQGFGSAPPGGSNPPIFGSFSSAPPEAGVSDMPPQGMYDPHQMPPPPAQGISFAAPVLVDVTPRALVVETAGGFTDVIIPRNSKIPCERTRRFATGQNMQTTVRVRVAQGEHQAFAQNTYLGEVDLSGLRPAPRGEVVVAVTFEVDADGTLRVRARDQATGQEARATLQLVGVADESSVVMMINRFAQQNVSGGPGSPIG